MRKFEVKFQEKVESLETGKEERERGARARREKTISQLGQLTADISILREGFKVVKMSSITLNTPPSNQFRHFLL